MSESWVDRCHRKLVFGTHCNDVTRVMSWRYLRFVITLQSNAFPLRATR
jgi:hypothetical protein